MHSAAEKQAAEWYISSDELLRRPKETGVAVDPENPAEIDDAIDVTGNSDGTYRVAIHISDAGLLEKDTPLVDQARQKGWSFYGSSVNGLDPMLPLSISKDKLSLNSNHHGLGAPAVTLCMRLDPVTRQVNDLDIYQSRLVSCDAISYRELAKRYVGGDSKARMIIDISRLLNKDIGRPSNLPNSYCHQAIGEYMLLANRIIAETMSKRSVPWLYRYHQTRAPLARRNLDVNSYVEAERDLLDHIGLAQYSTAPLRHEGLNFKPYTHFTSPLRRFPDLVNHQLLHAMLGGSPLPYELAELEQIAGELAKKTAKSLGLLALKSAA